jgi:hypothetical protein
MEQPPASVEIPIRQDVVFTAIGGGGEPGRRGGDGQHGMDGTDGDSATRTSDAIVRFFTPIFRKNKLAGGIEINVDKANKSIARHRWWQWWQVRFIRAPCLVVFMGKAKSSNIDELLI